MTGLRFSPDGASFSAESPDRRKMAENSGALDALSFPETLLSERAMSDNTVSEAEAAELLNVSVETLQNWRRNGGGPPCFKSATASGGRYRYYLPGLRQFVESNVIGPNACATPHKPEI